MLSNCGFNLCPQLVEIMDIFSELLFIHKNVFAAVSAVIEKKEELN